MSRTSRPLHIFPISLREIEVTAIEDLSPSFRRLTFRGPQLLGGRRDGHHLPRLQSLGFDDHVKIVVPDPSTPRPIGIQGEVNFEWAPGSLECTRDYTVRRFDPEAGELVIDVVRHEKGRAATWASQARVGDKAHCAGPKSSAEVNADVDWHLLIGDETAQPAIARWLDEAPAGTRARVFIEVPHADDVQTLPTAAHAEVTWLIRGDIAAGWSTLLFDAVQGFTPWPGRGYAWCAGETMTIKPIRRHLRSLLPTEDVEVVGYWRRTTGDGALAVEPLTVVRQVGRESDIVTPLVLRATVTLNIPQILADTPQTLPELAAALGMAAPRVAALVDSLRALDYIRLDRGLLRLSPKGEVLTDDVADHLSWTNAHAREELFLLHLVDVLTSGAPVSGAAVADPLATEREVEEELGYVLGPLAELPEVRRARTVTVRGDGAFAVASALASRDRHVALLVGEGLAAQAQERHASLPPAIRDRIALLAAGESPPTAECTVSIGETSALSQHHLTELIGGMVVQTSRSLILVNELADGAEEDDDRAGHALIALAATGQPLLRTTDLEAVLADHGPVTSRPLGWGFAHHVTCLDLAPR